MYEGEVGVGGDKASTGIYFNSVTDSQLCYRLPVIKLCNEGTLFLCTSTRKRLPNTFEYYKISLILIPDTMKYIASLKTRLKTALPHMDFYTHVPARHQKQFWCYSAHLYKGHNSNVQQELKKEQMARIQNPSRKNNTKTPLTCVSFTQLIC